MFLVRGVADNWINFLMNMRLFTKFVFSALLIFASSINCFAEIIESIYIGGLYYNVNTVNNTAGVVQSDIKPTGDVIIPETIDVDIDGFSGVCRVTYIGESAFRYCTELTSITIPNSVTSIGSSAFLYCIYNHRTTKTNQKYPSVNL